MSTSTRSKERMLHPIRIENLHKNLKAAAILLSTKTQIHALLATVAYRLVTHGWHPKRRHLGHSHSTHWRGRSIASCKTWTSHSRHWWCRQSKRQQLSIHVLQQKTHSYQYNSNVQLLSMKTNKNIYKKILSKGNYSTLKLLRWHCQVYSWKAQQKIHKGNRK